MDDNWESSRPPRSQSNTKSSSPVIQHNPLPFKLNPAGYAMNPYASHMFRYPVSVGMTRYPSRLPCMLATTPSSQGYAPYQPRPSPDIQVQQKEKDIQVMGAGKPNVVEASCYAREVTSPESSQAVPYQQQTWSGSGQDAHLHYPWPHGTSSIPITPSTVGLTVPYTAQPLSAAAVTAAPSENLYHLPADAASFSQYQLAAPRSQNVTSGSRHSRQK
ncbi:uncharacterized protein LOC106150692 [Lingula anatina]|uniref:Uncharacterized protein LOC106150692 n=1 Tax=Lingula anatina TaxID=7574 RepID=A0A1S3GYY8_LINAN|nr:uncharacterized protein LOC106150692 [Lingula anatina]|eukprot:XP_013379085.1 uncharacterized protein LOC106150692 [Lingula anatina]